MDTLYEAWIEIRDGEHEYIEKFHYYGTFEEAESAVEEYLEDNYLVVWDEDDNCWYDPDYTIAYRTDYIFPLSDLAVMTRDGLYRFKITAEKISDISIGDVIRSDEETYGGQE